MSRGATLSKALGRSAIFGCAGIDQHAPTGMRELETQRIGVGMARQIVRPYRRKVKQRNVVANRHPDVTARLKRNDLPLRRWRYNDAETVRIGPQRIQRRSDPERRVVEEAD